MELLDALSFRTRGQVLGKKCAVRAILLHLKIRAVKISMNVIQYFLDGDP